MQVITKLHYCTDLPIQYRYKKIKSVITALNSNVTDFPRETFADLKDLSTIPTLPLLQTPQGNFTNSNTIIRFLAAKADNKLYGANLHERALIDQWLDLTVCDFDACAAAINIYLDGKQVDIDTVVEDAEKFLKHLNKHLKNRKFIVGDSLSIADLAIAATIAPVLTNLYGEDERKKFSILNTWFQTIAQLNKQIEPKLLPKKIHKKFEKKKEKGDKEAPKETKESKVKEPKDTKETKQKKGQKTEKNKKQNKNQETKTQTQTKTKDEDDLFGDSDATPSTTQKPTPPPKPVKAKPAAKSIVVFNVKVFQQEQDLNILAEKIKKQITIDGLVWNSQFQIKPIAFGMNMLELGCVIEDSKVSIEQDVYEKLLEWETQIQSIDTVNFQKL